MQLDSIIFNMGFVPVEIIGRDDLRLRIKQVGNLVYENKRDRTGNKLELMGEILIKRVNRRLNRQGISSVLEIKK